MRKGILGGMAILVFAAITSINIKINKNKNQLDNFSLMNIEALAQNENDTSPTYQIAEATRTEASGGWTFDVGLKVWLLNGKVQKNGPTSSYAVKYKCCRPKGDVKTCPYESC